MSTDTKPLSERLADIMRLPIPGGSADTLAEAVELARQCEDAEWRAGQPDADRNEAAIRRMCAKREVDLCRGAAQLLVNSAIEQGVESISVEMEGVVTVETGEEHGDWIITARRVGHGGEQEPV